MKLKELKEISSISIVDLLMVILPNVKPKYYNFIISQLKNNMLKRGRENRYYQLGWNGEETSDKPETLEKIDIIQLNLMTFIFDGLSDYDIDFNQMKEFIDYNERGLIKNNDITSYKSFNDVTEQLSIVNLSFLSKELEKSVVKLFEDDEWLILKPLTHESSVKYGYGTTWCTAMINDRGYFDKYVNEGSLVYIINKITGVKTAAYREVLGEVSFWTNNDVRIDSLETNLPFHILEVIKSEFFLQPIKTNFMLLIEMTGGTAISGYNKDEVDDGYGEIDMVMPLLSRQINDNIVKLENQLQNDSN